MAEKQPKNPGKLILQAIILVSMLLVYFSDYATAGGGNSAQQELARLLFLQSLNNQGNANTNSGS